MRTIRLISIVLLLFLLISNCEKQPTKQDQPPQEQVDVESMAIPQNFSYRSSNDVNIKLSAFTNSYEPVQGISFDVYTNYNTPDEKKICCCVTDNHGIAKLKSTISLDVREVTVIGFMSKVTLPIIYNQVAFQFGGMGTPESPSMKNLPPLPPLEKPSAPTEITYTYLTAYTTGRSGGVPTTMTQDAVSASFLERIDDALPEQDPVPTAHPEYLASGNEIDLVLIDNADVWVTFLHEGAGYKNALGFYTYDHASGLPATPEDLSAHTIIFPNASLAGSGGGLHAGDKVYLGQFPAGTAIGWFLPRNAWNGTIVRNDVIILYSNPAWNPEDEPYNQHNVLLYDAVEQKLILGFEDLIRPGGDNDFNDAVFFISANPPEAIDTSGVQTSIDRGDPFFFNNSTTGTIGFEDKWPIKGDYDFNDLIVDYSFTEYLNEYSEITQIEASFTLRAIGASYHNGFAVEFPFADNMIQTFNNHGNSTIYRETGGRAIIFLFDDAYDVIPEPTNPSELVNTQSGYDYENPVTLEFTLTLTQGIPQANLQYTDTNLYDPDLPVTPPYNPFITIKETRGHEVHLPDYPATEYMDTDLYGDGHDSSAPGLWRYFKTNDNYPWALHIPTSWDYPVEKAQITWGFLDFSTWGESNGTLAQTWYNRATANVNIDYIYINE